MPAAKFVRDNAVLLVGLILPVLMMLGFLVASGLPEHLADPPKYDLVFAVQDYVPAPSVPLGVRLIVKDHVLKAQYTRLQVAAGGYPNIGWKKLYLYHASARTVRELSFGYPADMDAIEGTREEVVEATAGLRLDTTLQAPDGYELSYRDPYRGGLFTDIFFGSRAYDRPRLRKDGTSVPLHTGTGDRPFVGATVEFVGWVTGRS